MFYLKDYGPIDDSKGFRRFYSSYNAMRGYLSKIEWFYLLLNEHNLKNIYNHDKIEQEMRKIRINFNDKMGAFENNFKHNVTFGSHLSSYVCAAQEAFGKCIDIYVTTDNGIFYKDNNMYLDKINERLTSFIFRCTNGSVDMSDANHIISSDSSFDGLSPTNSILSGPLSEISWDLYGGLEDVLISKGSKLPSTLNMTSINDLLFLEVDCINNLTDLKIILNVFGKWLLELLDKINQSILYVEGMIDLMKKGVDIMTTVTLVMNSNNQGASNWGKINRSSGYQKRRPTDNLAYNVAIEYKAKATRSNIQTVTNNAVSDALEQYGIPDKMAQFVDFINGGVYKIGSY